MSQKKCRRVSIIIKKTALFLFLFLHFVWSSHITSLIVFSHLLSPLCGGYNNTRREEERLEGGGGGGGGGAWPGGPGNPEEEEEGRRRSVGRTTNRIGINIFNNNNTEIDTERITTITITTTESNNAKKARRTSPCSENNSIE